MPPSRSASPSNTLTLRLPLQHPLPPPKKISVEPRRVIIREGHTAECFYFVLSGVAAVKKLTLDGVGPDGDPIGKIVATIGRGATFGELALLQNSR